MSLPADDWRRIALAAAHRVARRDDAEDLAHDAIERVLRRAAHYPTPGDVARVTATTVRNLATDAHRQAARRPVGALDPWRGDDGPDVAAAVDSAALLTWCLARCRDASDRATVAAWAWGLDAEAQRRRWPALFPDARAVYDARRVLAQRLRRAKAREEAACAD